MRVIFGSSGFAKEVQLIIKRIFPADNPPVCFVCSDDDTMANTSIKGVPVVQESIFFEAYSNIDMEVYLGVGSPKLRKKMHQKIVNWNSKATFPILIDPSASVDLGDNNIALGQGVIICAGVAMTTDIAVGNFCHVNLNCTIGHDAQLGQFSTLSPAVNVSGHVIIGNGVFVGTGAAIVEGIRIVDNVTLGAGAVLISDVVEAGVYVGMPAKLKVPR